MWSQLGESKKYQDIKSSNNNHVILKVNLAENFEMLGFSKRADGPFPSVNLTYEACFADAVITDISYMSYKTATLSDGHPIIITIELSKLVSATYVALNS